MRKTRIDILNGPIYKQILIFFFPIMLGTFFQQLYNTVDAIVVGNFVGKEALAAVGGSTGTLINLLIGFIGGLASGATVVIAQEYGAGNFKGVKDGVKSGMFLGISLGLVLTGVGILFTPALLRMMNVPTDMFDYSVLYMRIYLSGLVPTMIYNVGSGILRAVGDSKRPLYFLIVSCVVNITLDVILVVVFNLGIVGVGVATVISQVASAILVMFVLSNKDAVYHYDLRKDINFDTVVLKRIVLIGLPMGIQSILYSISNLFIQAKVNVFGTSSIAAFTAFGKIDAIFWMISNAYGAAVVTIAGQCYGAHKYKRVKEVSWVASLMHALTSIIISLVCCLSGRILMHLFTNDEEVIRIGIEILYNIAPYWFTVVFVEVLSSSIRACGESLKPMIITAISICGVRILWILFYPARSVIETLFCYPITWILTSLLFLLYFLFGKWLYKTKTETK